MHGYAAVDDVAAPVGHDVGDGATAALVDFTQFPDLPGNFFFVEDAADFRHKFGVGVVAACLAAGTGVFAQADAVAEFGRVLFFIGIGKDRVEGGADVGRQDFAVAQGPAQPDFLVMTWRDKSSAMKSGKYDDWTPVLPTEPISSLSAKRATCVFSPGAASRMAARLA